MLQDTLGQMEDPRLPMVEVFQTVEGEGTKAGFPTTFVRVFNCNLRCTWCDTPYSYAPAKPEYFATISEIVEQVKQYPSKYICLTGGEPLMHGRKSLLLLKALAGIDTVEDIHIETNGAIHLGPFHELRESDPLTGKKARFILDYKLPASGENEKMILENFSYLRDSDEIKFVIGSEEDFKMAVEIVERWVNKGVPLFSPVWETMSPEKLVSLILKHQLTNVKLNLQIHKVIWDPDARGV
ncbi:radical SAM protein [Paenactinomyces guangxiensis]|uniref:7-carboxy-7-deazaguanine synthase n=1 Tax=Paenactinomyces guangxiensis TaxID=1490290 RepID=A0A7W1WRU7_9BACL|nr:radical SAM protein [Paenactinomyces guangxiensis]MBA4494901.1 radical SAM protein [Paenactinomyces guangxiensis]MBH8591984.1 radical SAM protein [Paenactinomyces guangxiensis]